MAACIHARPHRALRKYAACSGAGLLAELVIGGEFRSDPAISSNDNLLETSFISRIWFLQGVGDLVCVEAIAPTQRSQL